MKHLLVIPTYNEADNVENIVNEFFNLYPDLNILIVDDSSPDGTKDIVEKLKKKHSRLFIMERAGKQGLASAYIEGFKWGIENGYELFSTCDADLSHNPIYLKTAIEKIENGYDIACGSRLVKGGGTTEKHPFRKFITIGGNIWANFILGTDIKDILEGFNTYTKFALQKIDINKVSAKGFIFQAEMKYRAIKSDCKLIEFPILFKERQKGKSKMSSFIIIEAFFQILKLKLSVK